MIETLITGATGFVGPHLISALLGRGDRVRILALPADDVSQFGEEVAVYRGDIRQPEALAPAFKGVDTVFNLAATHGLWHPRQQYFDVNVSGLENVCEASLAAGIRRLVHMSTWTVCGFGNGRRVTEETPLKVVADTYQITKVEGERLIHRHIAKRNLPATIIRPDTIFGPGDIINVGRMTDRLVDGKAVIIGSGRNLLPLAYVSDIIDGTILAAFQDGANGQTYNIGNDQPLTQEEVWNCIAAEIGVSPPQRRVPYFPLFALATVAEKIVGRADPKRQPLVTRYGVQIFGTDNPRSIEKARNELGYSPKVSVREGVRRTAKWYLEKRRNSFENKTAP